LLLNILFEAGTGVVLYYLGKMVSNWKTGFLQALYVLYGLPMCFILQLFAPSRCIHY